MKGIQMLVSVFSPRRTRGRFISLVATAALAVGVLGLGAAPASAANGCTLTGAANGTVGVAQNLTFAGCLGATTLSAVYPGNDLPRSVTSSISVDASGAGTHTWTPQYPRVTNLSLNAYPQTKKYLRAARFRSYQCYTARHICITRSRPSGSQVQKRAHFSK